MSLAVISWTFTLRKKILKVHHNAFSSLFQRHSNHSISTPNLRMFCKMTSGMGRLFLSPFEVLNLRSMMSEKTWLLLMEKILHRLRLVVCPNMSRVLYIPGGDRRISEPSTVPCFHRFEFQWPSITQVVKRTELVSMRRSNSGSCSGSQGVVIYFVGFPLGKQYVKNLSFQDDLWLNMIRFPKLEPSSLPSFMGI